MLCNWRGIVQTQNTYSSPLSLFAANKHIYLSNSETIILETINVAGFSNLSLTITNAANSPDSISIVKVYGSNDGVNYFAIDSNALSSIAVNSTVNYHFVAVVLFIRITATSTSSSILDCYLVG